MSKKNEKKAARRGRTALLAGAFVLTLIGALSAAYQASSVSSLPASTETLGQEPATRAAHTGVAYYLDQLRLDGGYFTSNPAPHEARRTGDGSFQLQSAEKSGDAWKIVVVGRVGESTHRTAATLGPPVVRIPAGIVTSGAGETKDVSLELGRDALLASYDPDVGPFGAANVGKAAKISIRGSLKLAFMSSVFGDLSASGKLLHGDPLSITGTLTEDAPQPKVEDIDPIVKAVFESSRASNDNTRLAKIFGDQWKPRLLGSYGDLVVEEPGTYVIPTGTYRFRRFEIGEGATVVFDTSSGPSVVVYIGAGKGMGREDVLTVHGGSSVLIDPGDTTNGLLTVLGPGAGFKAADGSVFGQAVGEAESAGYSRIISISVGGTTSADDILATGGSKVYGRVYATGHDLTVTEQSEWHGSAVVRSLGIENGFFAVDIGGLGSTLETKREVELLARGDV